MFHETCLNESIDAVVAAVEGGINFIDVSPYYGHYKAETVLGQALKEIPRDRYYLSTKVGRYGEDGCQNDYLADVQRRYPDRFCCMGMAWDLEQVQPVIDAGLQGIAVPGHRLHEPLQTLMPVFKLLEQHYLERGTCPVDSLITRVIRPDGTCTIKSDTIRGGIIYVEHIDDPSHPHGLQIWKQEEVTDLTRIANENGLIVHSHPSASCTGMCIPEPDKGWDFQNYGPNPYQPSELITREQVLYMLSINGAWQLGLENERGSIKVGKYADFILIR